MAVAIPAQGSAAVLGAGRPPAEPTPWAYTALGDSLATGVGAQQGYVLRYREHVEADTGASIALSNLGVNGWTSGDLLSALTATPTFREAVASAQLLTWSIGGNDLLAARLRYKLSACGGPDNQSCLRGAVATFKQNWDAIVAQILALQNPGGATLRSIDIYNSYVSADAIADTWPDDGGLTDLEVLKPYLDEVNAHISTTLASNDIGYAAVYAAFNGPDGDEDPAARGYIAPDGLHPNDAGHAVIAELLRSLGLPEVP